MPRFTQTCLLITLLTLLACSEDARAQQYWDGSTTSGDGIVHGGTGTWTTSSTNWTTSTGASNSAWSSGDAIFTVAANGTGTYTVSLPASLSATSLTFLTGGYSITGAGTLTLTGTSFINVAEGAATINSALAGANTLFKTGAGQLILNGNGSGLTGGITLNAGSIVATGANTLGGASTLLTLNGGTGLQHYLQLTNSSPTTYGNNVVINGTVLILNDIGGVGTGGGAGPGVIDTFGTLALNGNLVNSTNQQVNSGISGLTFGAVTLGGNSSIQSINYTNNLPNQVTVASVTGSNSNLIIGGSGTTTITGTTNLGSGNLVKFNNGTLILNDAVTTTGSIIITQEKAGNVVLANSGAFVNSQSILLNGGSLTLSSSSTGTTVFFSPTATVTLAGGNLIAAQLTNSQSDILGTLNLGVGASTINNTGYTASGAQTFVFNNLGSRAQGGTISFMATGGNNGNVQFVNAPTQTNGIIGGWAVVGGSSFATLDSTGTSVVAAMGISSDGDLFAPDTIQPTDNALIDYSDNSIFGHYMGESGTANSLQMTGQQPNGVSAFDMGGYTMTLASGGLIIGGANYNNGYNLFDGSVTAGITSSPAELFVYLANQGGQLDVDLGANIIDNGAGGSVSLVLTGYSPNTLHLSGLNSYTGNTYVQTGGNVYILTDRQFGADPTSLNAGDITLSNGSTIVFQSNIVPVAFDPNRGIVLTAGGGGISIGSGVGFGALEMPISGVGPFSISAQKITLAGNNTYDGVTYAGGGNSTVEFTSIGNIGGGASSFGAPTTAANGRIIVLGANEGLDYVGIGASITDRQFEFDVANGGTGGALGADGAGALTLNGNLLMNGSPNNLYFSGYGVGIINGDIFQMETGATTLTTGGGGVWQLNGENTYKGQTIVGAGTLEFNTVGNVGAGPSSLGAPTDVADGTINLAGGTLRFIGTKAQSTDRLLSVTNNSGLQTTGSAPITFTGGAKIYDRTLTLGGTGQGFFSGAGIIADGTTMGGPDGTLTIIHPGALAMQGIAGQGTWTLNQNAVNTFTGGLSVNSGNLVLDFSHLSTPKNLVDSSNSLTLGGGNLIIQGKSGQAVAQTFSSLGLNSYSGSVINLNGASASSVSLTVGNVGINNYPSRAATLDVETTGNATMKVGTVPNVQGSGLISYITFNGNNFAAVTGGVLGAFTAYTGSLTTSTTGNSGDAYNLVGGLTMGNDVNLSALKITANGAGQTLDLGGDNLNGNGQTGILYDGTSNNYGYTISDGTITANSLEMDVIVAAGTLTISSTVAASNNEFVKAGVGTLVLSGNNSYSSNTDINYGTLAAGSNTGLSYKSSFNISAAGILATNGFNVGIIGANGNGIIQNGSGTASILTMGAGDNDTPSGYTYNFGDSFSGIIKDGGAGSLSLVKAGYGTQTLSEARNAMNTYSGSTTVASGILNIDLIADSGVASSIGTGSQINLGSYGQMGDLQLATSLTANQESNRSITLAAGGAGGIEVIGAGGVLGGGTGGQFDAADDLYGALVTLSGNINGAGTLLKLGLGNLDLSGANTYTGGTVVDFGILRFDTAASVPASGMITVNSGGTVGTRYAIDQAFLNHISSTSTGVVALGGNSSNNLDFTNLGGVALGAMGHDVFSGSITANSVAGYQLGGGGVDNIFNSNGGPNGPNSVLAIANANTITGNHNVTVSPHGTAGASVTFDDTQNFTGTLTVEGGLNANQILPNDLPNDGNNYNPGWMAAATLTLAGGQLPNVNGIILNPLGNLNIVVGATSANSLPSNVAITFNGGGLAFENDGTGGNYVNANYSQTLGAINLNRGMSEIFSQSAQGGYTSTLTFASINRSAGATITFAGNGLGASAQNEIIITNTGTLSTTSATPWAFVGGGAAYGNSDNPTDFAIISSTGVQAANGAIAANDSALQGGDYTLPDANAFNLTANRSANTIRVNSGPDEVISMGGHTLAVNGLMNVGRQNDNGYSGSLLTIGSTVGDGNLTAMAGNSELVLAPAADWYNSASDIVVNSNIIDNNTHLTLVKTGIGNLTLAGNNSFSGGIVEDGEGSLIFTSSNAFGTGNITLNSGSVQLVSGIAANTSIANNWVINADAAIMDNDNVAGLTLTGSIAINGSSTTLYWLGNQGQDQMINSAISGTGNLAFQGDYNWNGSSVAGILRVGGAASNTYTGLTSITGRPDGSAQTIVSLEKTGTATAITGNILLGGISNTVNNGQNPQQELLILNQGGVANWSANNIASTSVITFQGGNGFDAGVFQLNGNNQTLGGIQSSLAGDGIVENNSGSGTSTLTLNAASGTNYTFSGLMLDHDNSNNNGGTLAVVKNGAGTQTFTNANTYSGGTTINSGSFYANNVGTGSVTGSGALTLNTGATLGGTGTISSTINTISGNLRVGQATAVDTNTTSVLKMTASTSTIFSGANLVFNLNSAGGGTELALGATPTVNFLGAGTNTLTFDLQGSGSIINGAQYTLLTTTTNNAGNSVFGGDGFTLTGTTITGINLAFVNGSTSYAGSYLTLVADGTGYDIDLVIASAVPEPGTWALMLGSLALLVVWQYKRRKNIV